MLLHNSGTPFASTRISCLPARSKRRVHAACTLSSMLSRALEFCVISSLVDKAVIEGRGAGPNGYHVGQGEETCDVAFGHGMKEVEVEAVE